MIDAWNKRMKEVFLAGWVSCLDESMSVWTSKWTCPGFMFVPRKPHPQGNEYHTIACGLSGILYGMELVEGKDKPKESPPKKIRLVWKDWWIVASLDGGSAHDRKGGGT